MVCDDPNVKMYCLSRFTARDKDAKDANTLTVATLSPCTIHTLRWTLGTGKYKDHNPLSDNTPTAISVSPKERKKAEGG